jgi:predicted nucleotide-binding protein
MPITSTIDSQLDKVEGLLNEVQSLMDDTNNSLAIVLRRVTRLALLTEDREHYDLFCLHLEGIGKSKTNAPRHTPWENPDWQPKWDPRDAEMEDRMMKDGNIISFSIEELERMRKRLRDVRIEASTKGNTKTELEFYDLENEAENVLLRIRRRVDIFLQQTNAWLINQRKVMTQNMFLRSKGNAIFIGHGRSQVWKDLKEFIAERLKLPVIEFNSDPIAGRTTVERLSEMLDASTFAFLVLTGEDEHVDSSVHARENVVHEVGLFQGRLGFERAIVLMEEGCVEFSNIIGLTQIRFPQGNIMAKSEEIRRVLERECLI